MFLASAYGSSVESVGFCWSPLVSAFYGEVLKRHSMNSLGISDVLPSACADFLQFQIPTVFGFPV